MRKYLNLRTNIALGLVFAFLINTFGPIPIAQADEFRLPVPGVMVYLSPAYTPAYLKGIVIHPENALKFDFLVHKGDGNLDGDQKKEEYNKLIKYFLASLTVPDKDQWVNLSPYEKNRIIAGDFGATEMGHDLLGQDYLLKQITASLMYPESGLGKNFWDKVYERAFKEYGTTNIPVNTFNKVWIVPDEALIYESGNTAYVVKSHLKVMLEEDYLSLNKHTAIENPDPKQNALHSVSSKVIKEIILPEIEREVNEGKNFAMLRQVFSGMVLATWYKKALKESLLGKIYADKAKVAGVSLRGSETTEAIYQRYLQAFKKGVYNYIKEDADKYTNQVVPRKYFAGGVWNDTAQIAEYTHVTDEAMAAAVGADKDQDIAVVAIDPAQSSDAAMMNRREALAAIGMGVINPIYNWGAKANPNIVQVQQDQNGAININRYIIFIFEFPRHAGETRDLFLNQRMAGIVGEDIHSLRLSPTQIIKVNDTVTWFEKGTLTGTLLAMKVIQNWCYLYVEENGRNDIWTIPVLKIPGRRVDMPVGMSNPDAAMMGKQAVGIQKSSDRAMTNKTKYLLKSAGSAVMAALSLLEIIRLLGSHGSTESIKEQIGWLIIVVAYFFMSTNAYNSNNKASKGKGGLFPVSSKEFLEQHGEYLKDLSWLRDSGHQGISESELEKMKKFYNRSFFHFTEIQEGAQEYFLGLLAGFLSKSQLKSLKDPAIKKGDFEKRLIEYIEKKDAAMTNLPIADSTRAAFEAKIMALVDEIYQKFSANIKQEKIVEFKYILKWFLEKNLSERDFEPKIMETLNQRSQAGAIIDEAEKRRHELSAFQTDRAMAGDILTEFRDRNYFGILEGIKKEFRIGEYDNKRDKYIQPLEGLISRIHELYPQFLAGEIADIIKMALKGAVEKSQRQPMNLLIFNFSGMEGIKKRHEVLFLIKSYTVDRKGRALVWTYDQMGDYIRKALINERDPQEIQRRIEEGEKDAAMLTLSEKQRSNLVLGGLINWKSDQHWPDQGRSIKGKDLSRYLEQRSKDPDNQEGVVKVNTRDEYVFQAISRLDKGNDSSYWDRKLQKIDNISDYTGEAIVRFLLIEHPYLHFHLRSGFVGLLRLRGNQERINNSNALGDAHIKTMKDLLRKTEEELLKIDKLGKKSVETIKTILAEYGWYLWGDEQRKYMSILDFLAIHEADFKPGVYAELVSALPQEGIQTVADLLKKNQEELLQISGIKEKSVQNLKEVLKQHGWFLSFEAWLQGLKDRGVSPDNTQAELAKMFDITQFSVSRTLNKFGYGRSRGRKSKGGWSPDKVRAAVEGALAKDDGKELNMAALGREVGVSRERIRQIRKEIKDKKTRDKALISSKGGIDMNSANLNMQIKRDGSGVPLPISQQDMAQLSQIKGFVPRILEIRPALSLFYPVEKKSILR